MKKLIFLLTFPALLLGQGSQLPKYTVATLPAASSLPAYAVQVIDGTSDTDCTVGGATGTAKHNVICLAQWNGSAYIWQASASGGQTIIKVDGTPTTPASPVNLSSTTPAAPSGNVNVTMQQDGSADVSGYVPTVASQLQFGASGLPGGQYYVLYPSTCGFFSNPGNASMGGACGNMGAQNISGFNVASGYLAFGFTLPAGISQANITAVYAVAAWSFASAGISEYAEVPVCTDGTRSVYFSAGNQSQVPLTGVSVEFGSVPAVNSIGCKFDAEGSGYIYPGTGGYLTEGAGAALYIYYTGTPIASPDNVSVWPPLSISNGNLSLTVPFNVGYDTSNTNSYNITLPAFKGPTSVIAPGTMVILEAQNGNTSGTVTLAVNGITRPVKVNGANPAVGDIAGAGPSFQPAAILTLDGEGYYWNLENPQVTASGGGTTTYSLTGAAGGGASPGTAFNGSAAVTFDYHTFGAPGLAATTNTYTGTTNDFSATSQIKLPVAAGYASAANGEAGYDSTNKNWHIWQNGADAIAAMFPAASPPSDTNCAQWSVSGGVDVLSHTSSPCGTSSGGATFYANAVQYATSTTAARAATTADINNLIFGVDTGTATAYAVAVTPSPTVAADTVIVFLPTHLNSGAQPTLALNGGTAHPLVGDNNLTLQAGDLNLQTYARVQWNAFLTAWVLLNPVITGRPVTTATTSAGAYTFGDSTMYFGGDTTGCVTSGNQAGGVPAGGTGAAEVTCNNEPSLIVAAYNGVGKAFPASLSNFATGAYSNSTSMDVMDLQVLPNTTPADSGEPDYFLQMSEGDALVGGVGTQPAGYESQVAAAAGWLGAPRRSQMWATDSACVQSGGTWTADNTFHSGVALTSSTTGATLTCTTPYSAGTGVIAIWKVVSGGTATATFKIDGVTTATLSSGAAGTISTGPGNTAGWWGAAYSLSTTPTTHTFAVAVTSSGQPFTFVLLAMPQPQQIWLGLNYPRVFIGGPENYNSTTVAYDPYTQTAVSAVQAAGFTNVKYVSLINAIPDEGGISWTGGTYPNGRVCPVSISAGSAHPGDCGHLFESWAFLQAAGKTPNGSGVYSFNTRVGNVVPATADYSYSQVTNAAGLPAANAFTNTNTFTTPASSSVSQIVKGSYGSYAAPVVVQTKTAKSVTSFTLTSSVTAGDQIWVTCSSFSNGITVSDAQGDTFTSLGYYSAYSDVYVWRALSVAGGSTTVTASASCNVLAVIETSGMGGAVDVAGGWTYATSFPAPFGNITTSANDVIFTALLINSGNDLTPASNFSVSGFTSANTNYSPIEIGQFAAGTYDPIWTSVTGSYNVLMFAVAIKSTVSGGQTADLVDYENASGTVLSAIGPSGGFNSAATQTVVNCATSGTVTFSMPFAGTSYKGAIAYANACVGAAAYTYPTAFTNTPEMSGALSSIGSSTTTVWTVTGTTSTGFLKADGY